MPHAASDGTIVTTATDRPLEHPESTADDLIPAGACEAVQGGTAAARSSPACRFGYPAAVRSERVDGGAPRAREHNAAPHRASGMGLRSMDVRLGAASSWPDLPAEFDGAMLCAWCGCHGAANVELAATVGGRGALPAAQALSGRRLLHFRAVTAWQEVRPPRPRPALRPAHAAPRAERLP